MSRSYLHSRIWEVCLYQLSLWRPRNR